MALRLYEWNRRFLGLSTSLLFCASVGCTTTKDAHEPLTNAANRTNMGPGNAVSPPTPLIPAANNSGTMVARNPDPAYGPYSSAPIMPNLPTTPGRFAAGPTIQTPSNYTNPASFGSSSVQNNQQAPIANTGIQPSLAAQQAVSGQQMQVPQLPQPIAQQQHGSPTVASEPQTPRYQSQMPDVQPPTFEQYPPAPPVQRPIAQTYEPAQPTNQFQGSQSVPTYNQPMLQPTNRFQGSQPVVLPTTPLYNQPALQQTNQFTGSQYQQMNAPATPPGLSANQSTPTPAPQQINQFQDPPRYQQTTPQLAPPTVLSKASSVAQPPNPSASTLPAPPAYVPPGPVQYVTPVQLQPAPNYPAGQTPPSSAPPGPNVGSNAAAESLSEIAAKLDSGNPSTAPPVKVVSRGPLLDARLGSSNPAGEPIDGAPIYVGTSK